MDIGERRDVLLSNIRQLLSDEHMEFMLLTVRVTDRKVFSTGSNVGQQFLKKSNTIEEFLYFCKESNAAEVQCRSDCNKETQMTVNSDLVEVKGHDQDEGQGPVEEDQHKLDTILPSSINPEVFVCMEAKVDSIVLGPQRRKRIVTEKLKGRQDKEDTTYIPTHEVKMKAPKLHEKNKRMNSGLTLAGNGKSISQHKCNTEVQIDFNDCTVCIEIETVKKPSSTTRRDEHVCDFCGKVYKMERNLKLHVKQSHSRDEENQIKMSNKFNCDQCSASYNKTSYLNFHKLTHTLTAPLTSKVEIKTKDIEEDLDIIEGKGIQKGKISCHVCKSDFKRKVNMFKHFFGEHSLTFTCRQCGSTADSITEIREHISIHETTREIKLTINDKHSDKGIRVLEKDNIFTCSLCLKTFHFKSAAKRHIAIKHLKSKVKKWHCLVCDAKFWDKFTLDKHKEIHGQRTPYICTVGNCKATFLTEKACDNHTKTHKTFLCDHCGRSFKYLSYLQHHSLIHNTDKNFKCDICGKLYKSKNTLRCHMKVHDSLSRFVCEVCGKVFKAFSNLYVHMRMHNDIRNFKCTICNKAYRKRDSLEMHKLAQKHFTESENQAEIIYTECEICHKRFAGSRESYRFTRHLLAHSSAKTFTCDICSKDFKSSGSLKQHQRLHTGNIPACSLCGRRFRSARKLQQHFMDNHKEGKSEDDSKDGQSNVGLQTMDTQVQTLPQHTEGNSDSGTNIATYNNVSTPTITTQCNNAQYQVSGSRMVDVSQQFEGQPSSAVPSMQHFMQQTTLSIPQQTDRVGVKPYQNTMFDNNMYNTYS